MSFVAVAVLQASDTSCCRQSTFYIKMSQATPIFILLKFFAQNLENVEGTMTKITLSLEFWRHLNVLETVC